MLVPIAIGIAWSGFTLWTVKKLWRSSDDPPKARFYAEIKLSSLFVTTMSSLLLPIGGGLPTLSYWPEVAYWAFASFPVMVWAAYFGFRWFHAVVDRD